LNLEAPAKAAGDNLLSAKRHAAHTYFTSQIRIDNLQAMTKQFAELSFQQLAEKAIQRSKARTFVGESFEVKVIHAGENQKNMRNLQPIAEHPLTIHIS